MTSLASIVDYVRGRPARVHDCLAIQFRRMQIAWVAGGVMRIVRQLSVTIVLLALTALTLIYLTPVLPH